MYVPGPGDTHKRTAGNETERLKKVSAHLRTCVHAHKFSMWTLLRASNESATARIQSCIEIMQFNQAFERRLVPSDTSYNENKWNEKNTLRLRIWEKNLIVIQMKSCENNRPFLLSTGECAWKLQILKLLILALVISIKQSGLAA